MYVFFCLGFKDWRGRSQSCLNVYLDLGKPPFAVQRRRKNCTQLRLVQNSILVNEIRTKGFQSMKACSVWSLMVEPDKSLLTKRHPFAPVVFKLTSIYILLDVVVISRYFVLFKNSKTGLLLSKSSRTVVLNWELLGSLRRNFLILGGNLPKWEIGEERN